MIRVNDPIAVLEANHNAVIMKSTKFALVLCFLVSLIAGCQSGKFCMTGKDEVVTQTIDLDTFDGIELAIDGNVTIHRDSVQQVKITGHQNIIDNIEHHVVGGVWHIEYDQCVYQSGGIDIEIWMPTLRSVNLAGSGNITAVDSFGGVSTFTVQLAGSGDIDLICSADVVKTELAGSGDIHMAVTADRVEAKIAGSGNLDMRGTCRDENVKIAGSGDIGNYDLYSESADADIAGSGNIELLVNSHLNATITGSGNIYYKGNATADTQVTGSGRVKHVN